MENHLPSNIRHLRLKHKLKQEDFAKLFSVARSTVGNYENGTTEPNIAMLIRFSEHFKIGLTELIVTNLSETDPILPDSLKEADVVYIPKTKFQILEEKLDKIAEILTGNPVVEKVLHSDGATEVN